MSETSRSNAPWVIGVVAVIVLLSCQLCLAIPNHI